MQPFETIEVDTDVVACDGDGGVGGHPRVYLNLAGSGSVECPYCSRLFVRRGARAEGPGHAGAGPPATP
ncbi:MAG TPA: zinc-finger domain-containing protein [Stellaceae bacterium]|nr:zinc-finger domain-containing protein [Stellaceae bacterium]